MFKSSLNNVTGKITKFLSRTNMVYILKTTKFIFRWGGGVPLNLPPSALDMWGWGWEADTRLVA